MRLDLGNLLCYLGEWSGVEGREMLFGDADVFIPEVGMVGDEVGHEFNAGGVVEVGEGYVVLFEEIFSTEEVLVFADDDAWDFVEECGACAHDAGREC